MPALVTPFDGNGDLDLAAHLHNVGLLSEMGVEGFLLGGSTGEGPYLEPGERTRLAEATRRAAPRSFIMVGVAAESLRTAAGFALEAAQGEADAVVVMTPTTLVRHLPDLMERFYLDLAAGCGVPVFLYSVPRVTAYEIPVDVVARLASDHRIVGIKDSGGNPTRVMAMTAAHPDFAVFAGASAAILQSIAGGGRGAITASTNYAPQLVAEVVAAARRSPEAARPSQDRLRSLSAVIESGGVPAVKYAASRLGLRPGHPRRPLQPASPEMRRRIDAALAESAGTGADRPGGG